MSTTIQSLSSASAVGNLGSAFVPPNGRPVRNVQVSIAGSGAVSATVDVYASVDGVTFAKLYTVNLSGTGSDSALNSVYVENCWVSAVVTAIAGTSALVTAKVS